MQLLAIQSSSDVVNNVTFTTIFSRHLWHSILLFEQRYV